MSEHICCCGDCESVIATPDHSQALATQRAELAEKVRGMGQFAECGGWDEGGIAPITDGTDLDDNDFVGFTSPDTRYVLLTELLSLIEGGKG